MKNYDDIINLPHHISKRHTQMSISDRAAQFAPFAALTGYAEAINETGRLVDKKRELTEEEKINISIFPEVLFKISESQGKSNYPSMESIIN